MIERKEEKEKKPGTIFLVIWEVEAGGLLELRPGVQVQPGQQNDVFSNKMKQDKRTQPKILKREKN